MNKEKILNKIGALIDKADLTEEDLAKLFQNDEEPKAEPTESEQPKEEAPKGEQSDDGESAKESEAKAEDDGKAEEPKEADEKPLDGEEAQTETTAKHEEHCEANYETLVEKFDKLEKIVQGLSAENLSLRNALKEANVLEEVDGSKEVGLSSSITPNLSRDGGDLASTLAKLNRGRK